MPHGLRSARSLLDASIVEKESYFDYIDGLRGLAVLMILSGHVTQAAAAATTPAAAFHFQRLNAYSSALQIGVELFFILSAFTLFNTSRKRFFTDRRRFSSFYVRRAFRILPFWWLAVAAWAVVNREALTTIASGATFLFGFLRFRPSYQEPVPGGWSLFVEETFYLMLPLILLRVRSLPRAVFFLGGLMAMSVVWTRFAEYHSVLLRNDFYYLFPFENWFAFGYGIVAFYLIVVHGGGRVLEHRWTPLAADAIAIGGVVLLVTRGILPATLAMFLLVVVSSSSRTGLGKIMRIGLMKRFGRYCYSIYLTHFLLLHLGAGAIAWVVAHTGVANRSLELRVVVVLPIVAAISLGLAFVTFNVIERPCIRLGKRLVARLNAVTAPEPLQPAPAPAPLG